ncbi:helix-turn-helix domain-containing protein [Nocardia sp. CDC159]|uniref:Helix-turn-helix domain-containing protein n=1 Tax=Nocardia pulmonis TaxID=2951408 RepID=A0A9X2EDK3_9NOCA|nr:MULTISPECIES: helix-turn-helix domain-containing protein [Nocardia]MCM6778459.1 helix-turn-helix domain-containing protein [Nocardia pulmonis]MCM6791348.1 helix-turn-helix domain-containing protein [Nocardia sp. CDC159]
MTLVLDTSTVEPGNRAELVAAAILQMTAPAHIVLTDTEQAVQGRIETWQLGPANLSRIRTGGYYVDRTPRQIRTTPSPSLMIVVSPRHTVRWAHTDSQHEILPGKLYLADLNTPFEASWNGGEVLTLQMPMEDLGVSMESIRDAVGSLSASPMQRLITGQLMFMTDVADALENETASWDVGEALLGLTRGLITSEAVRKGDGAALPADALLAQIRAYIRRHAADSDLTVARIARAHYISVRRLYQLCANANFSLQQAIIEERLHQARRALSDPRSRQEPIAVIASHYGFRDPSHFARRFRAAFGMTPREWRYAIHREGLHTADSSSSTLRPIPHVTAIHQRCGHDTGRHPT